MTMTPTDTMQLATALNETDDSQIFAKYETLKFPMYNDGTTATATTTTATTSDNPTSQEGSHIMFDPLTNFKNLNDKKMNNNLSQDEYKNITPWRALTEVIAIPVVMMTFIVAVKINIFVKLILLFLIIIHIIVSTCLVSYLAKNYNGKNNNVEQSYDATTTTNATKQMNF